MATNKTPTSSASKPAGSMAELMARQTLKPLILQKGKYIEGVVKKLTPQEILLDIGAKGDALVIEYDKVNLANLLLLLKVGDRVQASVISTESEEGFPVVSLRRTLDDLLYKKLGDLQGNRKVMKVRVLDSGSRGGYFVESTDGVRGFLPNSQVLPETNITGSEIDACIIEIDREKKRIIFSQKATVYTIDPLEIKKHLKKDDTADATITTVSNHGLYVTIPVNEEVLIEGFIHISEISYQRVEDLQSLYKVGQKIKVQVLDFDSENRRINLSIKRLEKDKFEEVKEKYKTDTKVKGKITEVKSRGITVEIETGVIGFIPAAKIPSESTYKVGEMLEAEVTGIDEKRRLVLLSPVLTTKFVGYR